MIRALFWQIVKELEGGVKPDIELASVFDVKRIDESMWICNYFIPEATKYERFLCLPGCGIAEFFSSTESSRVIHHYCMKKDGFDSTRSNLIAVVTPARNDKSIAKADRKHLQELHKRLVMINNKNSMTKSKSTYQLVLYMIRCTLVFLLVREKNDMYSGNMIHALLSATYHLSVGDSKLDAKKKAKVKN
jgi:hypothetical protein